MVRERVLLTIAPACALVAVLLDIYGRLSIPLFTSPSFALAAGVAGVGVCAGLLVALVRPGSETFWRHVLYVAVLTVVTMGVLDVVAGGRDVIVRSGRIGKPAGIVLVTTTVAGVAWLIRRHAGTILAVASSVFLLSTVAVNPRVLARAHDLPALPPAEAAVTGPPPVIYVVFDAAMGISGLHHVPGGDGLATALTDVLTRHGFRVYTAAFSRHFASARSIPNALNLDATDTGWGGAVRHHEHGVVQSLVFDRLAAAGYEVVSYTTEYLDFCFPVASRCEVFQSFNPMNSFVAPARVRLPLLLQIVWSAQSGSYVVGGLSPALTAWLQRRGWPSGLTTTFADTYGFPAWFDRFLRDVAHGGRGRAYFAHFLVPHSPFVFDAACGDTGRAVVADFLTEARGLRDDALDRARGEGYAAYLTQYTCVAARIEALLDGLSKHAAFSDATVVIHGDHGSRISAGQYAGTQSDRDMIDNYSALYAIRRPGVEPGVDPRQSAVQRLSAEHFAPPGATLPPDTPTVVIDTMEPGRTVGRPMPREIDGLR